MKSSGYRIPILALFDTGQNKLLVNFFFHPYFWFRYLISCMFYFLLFITTIKAFNKLGYLRWSFALAKIPYSSIAKPVCIWICFVSICFSLFIKTPFEELHRVLFILSAISASQLKMLQAKIKLVPCEYILSVVATQACLKRRPTSCQL